MEKINKKLFQKTGFTLIELIIYIAVFVIVITLITVFVFNFIRVQAKIKASKEVTEGSQRALEVITRQIKRAQGIYLPTSSFDSHPGQISVETQENKPSEEDITYSDFYLDENNRLCLKQEGAAGIPLTSEKIKINNLIFNRLIDSNNNQSIRIELSAIYNDQSGITAYKATSTLISTVSLRND